MNNYFSKFNPKKFLITFLVCIVMVLIFAWPLKSLARLCEAPFWYLLVLSGIISYINAKVHQELKDKSIDPNPLEFFYIFSLSICIIFFTAIIGYPLAGYLICSSDVLAIISVNKGLFDLLRDFLTKPIYMTDGVSQYPICDKGSVSILKDPSLDGPLLADNTQSGQSKGSSSNTTEPSGSNNNNLPSKLIPGLDIDLKSICFGSLWPEYIRTGSVWSTTYPWLEKSAIPYHLQSRYQLENILANVDSDNFSDARKEVIKMEVMAEYRRRTFLLHYTGNDAKILEDREKLKKVEITWYKLYLEIGQSGPYRDNWDNRDPLNKLRPKFQDCRDVVYDFDPKLDHNKVSYDDLLKENIKAKYIADKWESTKNKSLADLNEVKSAWEQERANQSKISKK